VNITEADGLRDGLYAVDRIQLDRGRADIGIDRRNGQAKTLGALLADLAISGKAAQFGRGVLADVAGSLIDQFARSLEAELLGGATAAAETGSAAAAPDQAAQEAAPINALALAKVMAVPMAKRFAPAIGTVAAAGVLGFLVGRAGRSKNKSTGLSTEDLHAALLRLVS